MQWQITQFDQFLNHITLHFNDEDEQIDFGLWLISNASPSLEYGYERYDSECISALYDRNTTAKIMAHLKEISQGAEC